MLDNIALIASIICAVTAVTTSFRAVGISRESLRSDSMDKLRSCRVGDCTSVHKTSQRSSLRLHLVSTIIWLVLSVVFAAPLFVQKWKDDLSEQLILCILPLILLCIVLWFIWRKVVNQQQG